MKPHQTAKLIFINNQGFALTKLLSVALAFAPVLIPKKHTEEQKPAVSKGFRFFCPELSLSNVGLKKTYFILAGANIAAYFLALCTKTV